MYTALIFCAFRTQYDGNIVVSATEKNQNWSGAGRRAWWVPCHARPFARDITRRLESENKPVASDSISRPTRTQVPGSKLMIGVGAPTRIEEVVF